MYSNKPFTFCPQRVFICVVWPIAIISPNSNWRWYFRQRSEVGTKVLSYNNTDDQIRKIRTRKQRTDVGKHSFVNRTINSWKQLPAGLLASFPCKLNTFRKRVNNVVTSKGIQVGIECKKWCDVKWNDMIYLKLFYFEVKWSTVNLRDKIAMYIRVNLYWGYLIVFCLFHLVCILYCVCFNLLCDVCLCGLYNVWVLC
jgi:hypothetical protein